MPSSKNIEAVEQLTEKLGKASAIYFTDYLGLDVISITELRSQFFDASVDYEVAKNTLLKLAAKNSSIEGVDDVLEGPTAIALTYDDPTAPAKVLKNFTKDNDLPNVKGIIFEGEFLDGSEFARIASLPSKDELLSKLLSMLTQPVTLVARTLSSPMTNLVNALNQLKDQKS
ncbi:MAG: 50S ribosomal protein L10 [Candidatus Marinimicrobia bacterium]|jgi:large subunit ribosomal protein L10|nr:50S ribosomal protein L10 [Candidatus Neomarinimicrobiota bacterium]MDP6790019.1 50S ribosomal protein L10 [Candidatus Neomarinimicrobiota bacterium]MDP7071381.1 50S ribosomal protein L10 [Candidatus Neomarinimicrobiota bacterium]